MNQKKTEAQGNALPKKPNLLFIVTDQDRGLMHFPHGWERENLVAMPRLRVNGMSFTNAFCNTCMCSPSRTTWLTGLYPAEHGITLTLTENMTYSSQEKQFTADLQNMAHLLNAGGYDVNYIGKWHLSKDADGTFENVSPDQLAAFGFNGWTAPDAGEDTAPEHFGGGRVNNDLNYVNQAIQFLYEAQRSNNEKPFALFLSLVNPHDVLAYPNDWANDYAPSFLEGKIELPPTVNEELRNNFKPTVQQLLGPILNGALGKLEDDQMKRNYLNFYGNLIQHIDKQINTVLDVLYQPYNTITGRSLADSTVVIRMADHGEMGLTHGGLRQKAFNMYEETMSIPLVISNPMLFNTPESSSQLFSLVDIMPTINGLLKLGNPLNYTFRGKDLSPVILRPRVAPEIQDAILFTFDDFRAGFANSLNPIPAANRIRAIREKRWKYGYYFYIAPPEQQPPMDYPTEYEMYDLLNDPLELENLANSNHPRYNDPEVVRERHRLHARLMELEKEKLGSVTLVKHT